MYFNGRRLQHDHMLGLATKNLPSLSFDQGIRSLGTHHHFLNMIGRTESAQRVQCEPPSASTTKGVCMDSDTRSHGLPDTTCKFSFYAASFRVRWLHQHGAGVPFQKNRHVDMDASGYVCI